MNIREAMQKRIPRVRLPIWADKSTYLRLPLLPEGCHGPWAELYDDCAQVAMQMRPGEQKICVLFPDELGEEWEAFQGSASAWEKHPSNYAGAYENE